MVQFPGLETYIMGQRYYIYQICSLYQGIKGYLNGPRDSKDILILGIKQESRIIVSDFPLQVRNSEYQDPFLGKNQDILRFSS
jgi:hypothetical protein